MSQKKAEFVIPSGLPFPYESAYIKACLYQFWCFDPDLNDGYTNLPHYRYTISTTCEKQARTIIIAYIKYSRQLSVSISTVKEGQSFQGTTANFFRFEIC